MKPIQSAIKIFFLKTLVEFTSLDASVFSHFSLIN